MASAALLAAGCSTENKAEGTEYGTLKVSCTADGSIVAASDDTSRMPAAPSVPQAGDFTLTVTGESGTQQWDTLTEFEQSDAVFRMGTYAVSVAHGDPDAEGIDKPYYAAEKSVEVLPRRAATVEMTATIANSQTVVRATEQFLNYFHDAQFTVTTASGNQFDFTPGSTPADEPVFVKSATTLKEPARHAARARPEPTRGLRSPSPSKRSKPLRRAPAIFSPSTQRMRAASR